MNVHSWPAALSWLPRVLTEIVAHGSAAIHLSCRGHLPTRSQRPRNTSPSPLFRHGRSCWGFMPAAACSRGRTALTWRASSRFRYKAPIYKCVQIRVRSGKALSKKGAIGGPGICGSPACSTALAAAMRQWTLLRGCRGASCDSLTATQLYGATTFRKTIPLRSAPGTERGLTHLGLRESRNQ